MKSIFIFDIDGLVADAIYYKTSERIHEIKNVFGEDFVKDLKLTACNCVYMVYPGFYALFRWLRKKGHKIYFFSSGKRERNVELVQKIMEKSFGSKSNEVLKEVKIFSRNDCIDTTALPTEEGWKYQPKGHNGQEKKKLEDVVVDKQELPWTLLIDDDRSFMVKGEEANFLYVRGYFYYYEEPINKRLFITFHKAYYIRSVLEEIFGIVKKKNITLIKAKEMVMEKLEKELSITSQKCDYEAPFIPYVYKGLDLIEDEDKELKIYFDLK
jgi:hypothetical protein